EADGTLERDQNRSSSDRPLTDRHEGTKKIWFRVFVFSWPAFTESVFSAAAQSAPRGRLWPPRARPRKDEATRARRPTGWNCSAARHQARCRAPARPSPAAQEAQDRTVAGRDRSCRTQRAAAFRPAETA